MIVPIFGACGPSLTPLTTSSSTTDSPDTASITQSVENSTLSVPQIGAIYQDLATKGMDIEDAFAGEWPQSSDQITVDGNTYTYESAYASVDELKAATEAVFTQEYATKAFYGSLSEQPPLFIDQDGKLYRLHVGGWGGDGTADASTIDITSQTADTIIFTANVKSEVDYTGNYTLVNVNGAWRLACSVGGTQW